MVLEDLRKNKPLISQFQILKIIKVELHFLLVGTIQPESVLGIIEVKSNASIDRLTMKGSKSNKSAIEKCEQNGMIIGSKKIFNGIWGYESKNKFNSNLLNVKIAKQLRNCQGYLNHISFNSKFFCRYWEDGNPVDRRTDSRPCYSFYDLSSKNIFSQQYNGEEGLSFGYFISNLLEYVYRQIDPQVLSDQYFEFLYPIEWTKEMHRLEGFDIKIG